MTNAHWDGCHEIHPECALQLIKQQQDLISEIERSLAEYEIADEIPSLAAKVRAVIKHLLFLEGQSQDYTRLIDKLQKMCDHQSGRITILENNLATQLDSNQQLQSDKVVLLSRIQKAIANIMQGEQCHISEKENEDT